MVAVQRSQVTKILRRNFKAELRSRAHDKLEVNNQLHCYQLHALSIMAKQSIRLL